MTQKAKLPLLQERRAALETCGYCPKLCRAACPVSNVEKSETLIPWGKMSLAWFLARGDLPIEESVAHPAWACTGCFACRDRCEHANPVAETLFDARADLYREDAAPAAARAVVERHSKREQALVEATRRLQAHPGVSASASNSLLVGCSYVLDSPEVAREALDVVSRLAGPVRLIPGCCGAPLQYAGHAAKARQARIQVMRRRGAGRLFVVDPGCAVALRELEPTPFVDLAQERSSELGRAKPIDGPVRWHDPCQLGRGLGRFDEPREVLGHVLGRPPEEFSRNRSAGVCSGGGGLLPVTMPETSTAIARMRVADHEQLGGGTVVTACASSHRKLRSAGARVVDLVSLVRQALDEPADE